MCLKWNYKLLLLAGHSLTVDPKARQGLLYGGANLQNFNMDDLFLYSFGSLIFFPSSHYGSQTIKPLQTQILGPGSEPIRQLLLLAFLDMLPLLRGEPTLFMEV